MNSKTKTVLAVLFAVFLLPAASALSEEGVLKINPGLYSVEGKTKTNLDDKPHLKTSNVCIKESEIRPETMLPSSGNCTIRNLKSTDNTASFDISCDDPAGGSTMKGKAEYSTKPDFFTFKYELKGQSQGKEMTVVSEGKGERKGVCAQ